MSVFDNIPRELRALPVPAFLVWRSEQMEGEKKPRKVPYYADGSRRRGEQGAPEDRARLATFEQAVKTCEAGKFTGIGLAMLPENGLVGLDFDNCLDASSQVLPEVLELVRGTYAEISPSGRGVRAFMRGTIGDNKSRGDETSFGFETFHGKGFLTLTGNVLDAAPDTVAPLSDQVREYAKFRFGSAEPTATEYSGEALTELSEADRKVLHNIIAFPPYLESLAGNEEWSAAGYHLLSLGAEGRQLFIELSHNAPSFEPGAPEQWWDEHANQIPKTDYRNLVLDAKRRGWKSVDFGTYSGDDASLVHEQRLPEIVFSKVPLDLLTQRLPEREWALHPYLPLGTTANLSAIGGLGKTHVLLHLAICVALGLSDFHGLACSPGRVVILTAEDDRTETMRRVQKILGAMKRRCIPIDMQRLHDNLEIVDMIGLGAEALLTKLERTGTVPTPLVNYIADRIGQATLIAFDTQSRFNGGPENDNGAAAVFVSACETIAKKTGACVLIVSHTGKAMAREGMVDQYASRGASASSDNSRSVMVLAPPLKAQIEEVYELDEGRVASGDIFRLVHVKSNYARKQEDLFFERQEDGAIMPFNPPLKALRSEDEFVLKLHAYAVKQGEITYNEVYKGFEIIFQGALKRKDVQSVFDKAVSCGYLKLKRKNGKGEYFEANTSMGFLADAPSNTGRPSLILIDGGLPTESENDRLAKELL